MYNTGILELRQTGENDWKARYQGNYGVYTIKVTMKDKKAKEFSCSCPSRYYPCKHIPMIERAVAEKIVAQEKLENRSGPRLKDFITKVPADKLREFILNQTKYNAELQNAAFFEFAEYAENAGGNKYSNHNPGCNRSKHQPGNPYINTPK